MTEYHYAIVERPVPPHSAHDGWDNNPWPRLPLMQHKAFEHLQQEGPWLVTLGGDPQAKLVSLEATLGEGSIIGLLTSYVQAKELCEHLSLALVAQMQDGQTVLLRSYTPQVMLQLHASSDSPWRSSLFGPINKWTVKLGDQPHHVRGGGLTTVPDYQPIVLDADLLNSLAVDSQALALLDEMERSAPDIFSSTCHGDRLEKVSSALDVARRSGLQHPEDQLLFATLTLLEGTPPDQTASWKEVLEGITVNGLTLSESFEISMDNQLT